jgi:hypothetical protein
MYSEMLEGTYQGGGYFVKKIYKSVRHKFLTHFGIWIWIRIKFTYIFVTHLLVGMSL